MKSFSVSCLLLALLIACLFITGYRANDILTPIRTLAEALPETVTDGANAEEILRDMRRLWDDSSFFLSLCVPSPLGDRVEGAIGQLEASLAVRDETLYASARADLLGALANLAEAHTLSLRGLL